MTSAELLEQARAAYVGGTANYRDCRLKVGALLHQFILARLKEGDGLTEAARLARGCTRGKAMRDAAAALGVSLNVAAVLVSAAMAVELLGQGVDLGGMAFTAVYWFKIYIQRRTPGKGNHAGYGNSPDISDSERWEIKSGQEKKAVEAFRKAAVDGCTMREARRIVMASGASDPGKVRRREPHREERAAPLQAMKLSASRACPGDVAEMCEELIASSEDPRAAAEILKGRLEKYLTRKRPHAFAD